MRLRPLILSAAVLVASAGWWLTSPHPLPRDALNGLSGDTTRGARVFHAAGCASCHTSPGAEFSDRPKLGGGQRFPSPFGTFVAPNISPDPQHGIGGWSAYDLANALLRGVSPKGSHYYPAFPYTTYVRASVQDVVDLKSFLDTLPPVARINTAHEVGFPFNIRRGLGLWKRLFLKSNWITPAETEVIKRGRVLVEALGHCGECHTPRNRLGGLRTRAWLTGAPDPSGSGKGKVPDISGSGLDWAETDIAYYLQSGFTPEFDSVGGHMAHVVENLSRLPDSDRAAIAAYLKALPETR